MPVETQERLKKTIPGVEIVTVPDVGHYPDWEKPAETFAVLDRSSPEHAARFVRELSDS